MLEGALTSFTVCHAYRYFPWDTDDRRYSCFRVVIRPRPQNTYWRRSGDADACSANCVALLRRPPSAASNSSLSATAYVPATGAPRSLHETRH